ncbi:hypothetical protein FT663_02931 [Candidozyma haemuli var. vulneris]|uniref:Amino acid transporter transmembrane domain-containing protein n=1 Tax=Candidozyma haemuli TaxID=45357 RepID=A0A2V1AX37_9ASCO|nr:hypothetical protein CXQ85_005367 [[Candida] haemuloni]KAF3987328.1 hypothetical protein FT662_04059 [[Candida] haemuloni var. vulneris]KAF3990965.1 hypothetical protein FT663_02931 [[Candida] haemuloni var. vulneris]PVH22339.1 hypothetical protein CXQ85_005367 [[Candida] haemuloni]
MSSIEKKNESNSDISPQVSELLDSDFENKNVFALKEDGPNFRGVTWIGAAGLVAKTQFGYGILGLPGTFQVLGFVPGLISLISLCALTTWTGYMVGSFRIRYPNVYGVGDAAELIFGPVGREFMGGAFWLFYTLCYGAAVLTLSIAFNAITEHATCTMVWVAIGAVIALVIGTGTRTLKNMSWLGLVALGSVFFSVWPVTIAVLAQSTPEAAPAGEPIDKQIVAVATGRSFAAIASAIATQLSGLCATAAFFTIHSEMRNPRDFTKSLLLGQGFVSANYIIVTCIIYGRVGRYVTSPALGSAGPLMMKICYGIALPGLFFSCFFQAHIAGKHALVRLLRDTKHLQANTKTHWFTWISMMLLVVIIGFVIASSIPFFNDLLALIAALLGSLFTLIMPAILGIYIMSDYHKQEGDGLFAWVGYYGKNWNKNRRNIMHSVVAVLAIAFGLFILVGGTYGAIDSIIDGYRTGRVSRAFSCEDNSN